MVRQILPSPNRTTRRTRSSRSRWPATRKGLPPATIINAEIDPLRTDGEKLEKAFKAAGVAVERKVYDGVTHEFFGMAAVVPAAKEAQAFAAQALKSALTK